MIGVSNLTRAVDALVVLVAAWTAYAQACALVGASFAALRSFSWLPILIAGALLTATRRARGDRLDAGRLEFAGMASLCLLAAVLTAGANRPNPDDAFFLNVAVSLDEFPDVPLHSVDTLHRAELPPFEQVLHMPQTYEVLVGLLSSVSGVSAPWLYWVLLPPLWAAVAVLATWRALRELLEPRAALVATAIGVFLLICWGDGVRTFGNFAYPRLFQGKAIAVTVLVPLIVLAALRYRRAPNVATWTILACSQVAAVGMTTDGLLVAPLTAGLALVAPPFEARSFVGLTSSAPVLIGGALLYAKMAPYLVVLESDGIPLQWSTMLGATRTPLVVVALVALPILARRARSAAAGWLLSYVCLIALLFVPIVPAFAREHGYGYSWRLWWSAPIPLLVSLAGGLAAGGRGPVVGALAVWLAAFAAAGPVAVNEWRASHIGQPKAEAAAYVAAREIVRLARKDAPTLAPESVAIYVTSFSQAPPLVGVRRNYLYMLSILHPEGRRRWPIFDYVSIPNPMLTFDEAIATIEADRIATVAFRSTHADAARLEASLRARGFAIHHTPGYVIAVLR